MSVDALFRKVAGLFMVGFQGPQPDDAVKRLIDDGIGGVILFKRNITSAEQTSGLIQALKRHAGRPLLAAVDQEGGRVARLRGAPFTALPSMRDLGRRGDLALIERAGRLLAFETRALGFDWDFAPVLDVDTNPNNPVIGDRSFSNDAQMVSRCGIALAQGLEAGGVASCGKHFPGHGDTNQDSHLDLPSLPHAMSRLREIELVPFVAYARAGLASIMTAHVIFEAVAKNLPATLSREVMTDLLRTELGFSGVIVSDDLEMKAIADHYSVPGATVQSLAAGVDFFLICHKAELQRASIEAVVQAIRAGSLPESRIDDALSRVSALTRRFARGPEDRLSTLGSAEHQALATGLDAGAFTGVDPTEVMLRRT